MKKVVILGDSLSLPRPYENVLFEDTYPYILQTQLGENWLVINRSRRANHARKQSALNAVSDDIHDYQPQALIYHLGIVDCAPRLFSELEQKLIDRLPVIIKRRIISFFSKTILR